MQLEAARAFFRPELLNRLDDIVVFDSLTLEELERIVDPPAGSAEEAPGLATAHPRGLLRGSQVVGVDRLRPVYGARPLRRLVQTAVGDRLAKALLGGEIEDGPVVRVDVGGTG